MFFLIYELLCQLIKCAKQDNQQKFQMIPMWHKNPGKKHTYLDKRKCQRRQEEGLSIQPDLLRPGLPQDIVGFILCLAQSCARCSISVIPSV